MPYNTNKKLTGLDVLTTLASGDLHIVGDVSDSGRAKAITEDNLETTIANSTNFTDALIANTNFTTDLANDTNFTTTLGNNSSFVSTLTSNSTFQSSVNSFVTGGGGGGGGGFSGKPQTISLPFADYRAYAVSGYTDVLTYFYKSGTPNIGANTFYLQTETGFIQNRQYGTDMASANDVRGFAKIGSYLYCLLSENGTGNAALYRYDANNLSAGGTLMTISGASITGTTVQMTSNGTHLFFSYDTGNSANAYAISKFTISGTTATYVSTVNCGSTASQFSGSTWFVDSSGNIYGTGNTSGGNSGGGGIYKYDSAGTLVTTFPETYFDSSMILNYSDTFYCAPIVGATTNEHNILVKLLIEGTDISSGSNNFVGTGDISNSAYFNIQIPFTNTGTNTGTYTKPWSISSSEYDRARSSYADLTGNAVSFFLTGSILPDYTFDNNKNVVTQYILAYESGDTTDSYHGITEAGTYPGQSTKKGAYFFNDGGVALYAVTNDGSTENQIAITGITLTNRNVYRIETYPTAGTPNVKFYVNGVLKATSTSNLPFAATTAVGFGVIGIGNNTHKLNYMSSPTFTLEI